MEVPAKNESFLHGFPSLMLLMLWLYEDVKIYSTFKQFFNQQTPADMQGRTAVYPQTADMQGRTAVYP